MEDSKEIKQPDAKIEGIGQQLRYPLDFVTQEIIKKAAQAWPIGAIFISVSPNNPAELLGYGTWEAFGAGRTLVGLDSGQSEFNTVEETGGAKTHTLTESEMPAHTHGGVNEYNISTGTLGLNNSNYVIADGVTDSTGGGAAHNNLQPYVVVYFFKRIA